MKLHQLNDSLFRCDLLGLLLNDMAGGDGCGLFGWVRATDHPSIFNWFVKTKPEKRKHTRLARWVFRWKNSSGQDEFSDEFRFQLKRPVNTRWKTHLGQMKTRWKMKKTHLADFRLRDNISSIFHQSWWEGERKRTLSPLGSNSNTTIINHHQKNCSLFKEKQAPLRSILFLNVFAGKGFVERIQTANSCSEVVQQSSKNCFRFAIPADAFGSHRPRGRAAHASLETYETLKQKRP